MNTLEASTQLGGFNQRLTTRQSKKCFPYSGSHQHEVDTIWTFFSSVKVHDGTTAVELIVVTNTLLKDVYTIGSISGLNIAEVPQDRLREREIPINIWSDIAQ